MKKYRLILPYYQVLLTVVLALAAGWFFPFTGAVAAPSSQQGTDLAVISSPASNEVVRGVVSISGSSDHSSFQFYKVEFHPEPVTGDRWQIIGAIHNTPVINGILENWDTTTIPDGSYTIRLQTVKQDGNYLEAFSQQVVVANAQPTPTDTPPPTTEQSEAAPNILMDTPTALPPTPTIMVEQPVVETATPRPVETSPALQDPNEVSSFVPTVTGFSLSPLRNACLYGAGVMLSVFLLFGFLAALRTFMRNFADRLNRK